MLFSSARANPRLVLICSLGIVSVACGDDDSQPLPAMDAGPDAALADSGPVTDTTNTSSDGIATDTETTDATETDTDTTTNPDLTLVLDAGNDGGGETDVTEGDPGTTDGATTDTDTTDSDTTETDATDGDTTHAATTDADATDGDTTEPDATDGTTDADMSGFADAGTDADVDVPDGSASDADIADGGAGGEVVSIRAGSFLELAAADAGVGAGGQAQLVVLSNGETRVEVQVVGMTPYANFPIHVHQLPCEFNQGGAHYKIDPSVEGELASNEIWLEATTNADGYGNGRVTSEHEARGDAMSVVVHDPETNDRLLCADLLPENLQALSGGGSLAPFAAAESVDQTLTGGATLLRNLTGTTVSLTVNGLSTDVEYVAHVHALPCEVSDAGGHYKLDPTVEETQEANELWLPIENEQGSAESEVGFYTTARLDAQSVVLHRVEGSEQVKVGCANLAVEGWEALETTGFLTRFPPPIDAGLFPEGEGRMLRKLDGTTEVSVTVSELEPSTEYGVHVHNLPCSVMNGGSHYKLDESVLAEVEANEIWLSFTTNQNGAGTRTVEVAHLARPEAQSIVVHGVDNVRLGCVPLQHFMLF